MFIKLRLFKQFLVYVMDIHGKDCSVNFSTDDANIEQQKEEKQDVVDINRCHDIAIVGAGAGGTYTAYRLRKQNLSIAVYEQLDRVGGRLFSVDVPGTKSLSCKI